MARNEDLASHLSLCLEDQHYENGETELSVKQELNISNSSDFESLDNFVNDMFIIDNPPSTISNMSSISATGIQSSLHYPTIGEEWPTFQGEQTHAHSQPHIQSSGSNTANFTFGEMTLEDFLIMVDATTKGCSSYTSSTLPSSPSTFFVSPNFQNGSDMPWFGNNRGGIWRDDVKSIGNTTDGNDMLRDKGLAIVATESMNVERVDTSGYSSRVKDNFFFYGHIDFALQRYSDHEGAHGKVVNDMNKRRKQFKEQTEEALVEPRMKRMIKNRESAARSRAKKQAYTMELQVELDRLEEENALLKQKCEDLMLKMQMGLNTSGNKNDCANAKKTLKTLRRFQSI